MFEIGNTFHNLQLTISGPTIEIGVWNVYVLSLTTVIKVHICCSKLNLISLYGGQWCFTSTLIKLESVTDLKSAQIQVLSKFNHSMESGSLCIVLVAYILHSTLYILGCMEWGWAPIVSHDFFFKTSRSSFTFWVQSKKQTNKSDKTVTTLRSCFLSAKQSTSFINLTRTKPHTVFSISLEQLGIDRRLANTGYSCS